MSEAVDIGELDPPTEPGLPLSSRVLDVFDKVAEGFADIDRRLQELERRVIVTADGVDTGAPVLLEPDPRTVTGKLAEVAEHEGYRLWRVPAGHDVIASLELRRA